jgi:hypothetical protein
MRGLAKIGLIIFLLVGCTRNAARRNVVIAHEQERTRELIQGAKLANLVGRERLLTTASNEQSLVAYDLSGNFLGRAQSVVGLPIVDQSEIVSALLSTNRALRLNAEQAERDKVAQEQSWRAERADYEGKLQEMGAKYEAERNRSIVRRFWRWLVSSIGIGGIIVLCVFCPAVIPIFGRLLGWLVSKVPQLAGALGVVSTKAYDAIVRGVENAKQEWHRSDAETVLHSNLSSAMDESHKKLVRVRKVAVA